jgi:hypothetical protein
MALLTSTRFYGYDQGVFGNVIINENFLHTFGYPSANMQGTFYYRLSKEPDKVWWLRVLQEL